MRTFKMKKIFIYIVMLMVILLPSASYSSGPSGAQVVSAMNVDNIGKIRIYAQNGEWLNPDACDSSSEIIILPSVNGVVNKYYSEMFALVTASFLQNKRVSGMLNGCAVPVWGAGTIPIVTTIGVYK